MLHAETYENLLFFFRPVVVKEMNILAVGTLDYINLLEAQVSFPANRAVLSTKT